MKCKSVPRIANATANVKQSHYGEGVWYECRTGYVYRDDYGNPGPQFMVQDSDSNNEP